MGLSLCLSEKAFVFIGHGDKRAIGFDDVRRKANAPGFRGLQFNSYAVNGVFKLIDRTTHTIEIRCVRNKPALQDRLQPLAILSQLIEELLIRSAGGRE